MARRTGCRAHCRECGVCFSSDGAFDAHRRGRPEDRYCVDVFDDSRFVVKTAEGQCVVRGDVWGAGVSVWTLARNVEHRAPWGQAA